MSQISDFKSILALPLWQQWLWRAIRFAGLSAVLWGVSACGGGGSSTTTKISISSVKAFGDSLVDSGTFGFKFTVQTTPVTSLWNERVAATYGVTGLCARYEATSLTTVGLRSGSSCTNYAVGGGGLITTPMVTPRGFRLPSN